MIEHLWKIYEANKEWIKFADTKAIAFIAIIGVLFNFLYSIKDKFLFLSNFHFFKILYFASFVLLAISLLCSVYCLLPRTSKTDIVDNNVIYYKAINDNFKDEKEYYNAVKCSKDSFEEQLSAQNYQLAKVATKKYSIVKVSLILFSLGFLAILIIVFC